MLTLPSAFRDYLNLKIENKPELLKTLKKFKDVVIEICFIDKPLKDYCLIFKIDSDGLLKTSSIENYEISKRNKPQSVVDEFDVRISIDNAYLRNLSQEFVGWSLDFSNEGIPNSSIFTNGLKIEGDANTIQELAPLLKLIINDFSPLILFMKKSPFNYAVKNFLEYILHKEKILVVREDFESFVRDVRGFRNNFERIQKKLEILEKKTST